MIQYMKELFNNIFETNIVTVTKIKATYSFWSLLKTENSYYSLSYQDSSTATIVRWFGIFGHFR